MRCDRLAHRGTTCTRDIRHRYGPIDRQDVPAHRAIGEQRAGGDHMSDISAEQCVEHSGHFAARQCQ